MNEQTSLIMIIIGAALVNNVVLSQFLGICSFLGVSSQIKNSAGLGGAVIFVITIASAVANLLYTFVLHPLGLDYLQTIVFIIVIAALVQVVEMFLKKTMPALYTALGIYLPLITTNCAVLGVALLVLRVHGHEAQHHEVEEGADDREAREDVDEAEGHVLRLRLQRLVLLQRHVVAEANGGERDEAVVVGLEEGPVLVVGEGSGADAQRADAREETDEHHVGHGHVCTPHAQPPLGSVQQVLHEGVDALAQALEHDQRERDAQKRVEHAEHLAAIGAGCRVAVA